LLAAWQRYLKIFNSRFSLKRYWTMGNSWRKQIGVKTSTFSTLTGYDGHRTAHEFTCSILAISVPTSLIVLFQVATQNVLTSLRYIIIMHCEISRKVGVMRNIVDVEGRSKSRWGQKWQAERFQKL